jgi:hypothetical protein
LKKIFVKKPGNAGLFSFLHLRRSAGSGFRILSRLVLLLGAILPHLKHGAHPRKPLQCAVGIDWIGFLLGAYRMRVTLKKNLENLRFANHLSP